MSRGSIANLLAEAMEEAKWEAVATAFQAAKVGGWRGRAWRGGRLGTKQALTRPHTHMRASSPLPVPHPFALQEVSFSLEFLESQAKRLVEAVSVVGSDPNAE